MTKRDKLEAYKMRLEGKTLQYIANHFGVTREYIRQITPAAGPTHQRDNYIFPNIAKWLVDNGIYNYEFAEMIQSNRVSVGNWLLGKTEPSLFHIEQILKVTGMSFEEAFKRKGEQHATH